MSHDHPHGHHSNGNGGGDTATAVLEVSGVQWASSKAVAETVLGRRPGVLTANVHPVAQTATVTFADVVVRH